AARGHDSAIGVAEDGHPRIGRTQVRGGGGEVGGGRGQVFGVEGAGDVQWDDAGTLRRVLRQRREGIERAGSHGLADAGDSRGAPRARAGVFAVRAERASSEPAATVWPPPLTLAGLAPAASMAESTSSGWPPTTADVPVGVVAAAEAMPRPRTDTKRMASAEVRIPAICAAAISPTECPATTPGLMPSSAAQAMAEATRRG